MSPKPIGVVGGAGPFAGLCLLDRLFSIAQSRYGCVNDKDFPLIILYSFPFSDMLSDDRDEKRVSQELLYALNQLDRCGAKFKAIACNTLHGFIPSNENIIAMPDVVAGSLQVNPLVLCTSTSRRKEIHKQAFDCLYPDDKTQNQIDEIIRRILKGEAPLKELQSVIDEQREEAILLGCTELSLFAKPLKNKILIDPLELLANKLLEESFK
ncbi:MAG: aspartate/glutamate racemase family protein [Parachlamydiaceae bacterium]